MIPRHIGLQDLQGLCPIELLQLADLIGGQLLKDVGLKIKNAIDERNGPSRIGQIWRFANFQSGLGSRWYAKWRRRDQSRCRKGGRFGFDRAWGNRVRGALDGLDLLLEAHAIELINEIGTNGPKSGLAGVGVITSDLRKGFAGRKGVSNSVLQQSLINILLWRSRRGDTYLPIVLGLPIKRIRLGNPVEYK